MPSSRAGERPQMRRPKTRGDDACMHMTKTQDTKRKRRTRKDMIHADRLPIELHKLRTVSVGASPMARHNRLLHTTHIYPLCTHPGKDTVKERITYGPCPSEHHPCPGTAGCGAAAARSPQPALAGERAFSRAPSRPSHDCMHPARTAAEQPRALQHRAATLAPPTAVSIVVHPEE